MTGRDHVVKSVHKDFEVRKDWRSALFVVVSGPEDICLLVGLASLSYVHYPVNEKKKLANALNLQDIEAPAFSIFAVHEYPRNWRRGYRFSRSTQRGVIRCVCGAMFCNQKVYHKLIQNKAEQDVGGNQWSQ